MLLTAQFYQGLKLTNLMMHQYKTVPTITQATLTAGGLLWEPGSPSSSVASRWTSARAGGLVEEAVQGGIRSSQGQISTAVASIRSFACSPGLTYHFGPTRFMPKKNNWCGSELGPWDPDSGRVGKLRMYLLMSPPLPVLQSAYSMPQKLSCFTWDSPG